MKKCNKYINILNILTAIVLIAFSKSDMVLMYIGNFFAKIFEVIYILVLILNLIISVINFVKKNIKVGIGQTLVTVCFLISLISRVDTILVATCIGSFISIINLIFNKNTMQIEKRNNILLILFLAIMLIEISTIVIPNVFNLMNLYNLKNAILNLEQEKNMKTIAYKEDDLYIFIDELGNEISKIRFDHMNESYIGIQINGKKVNMEAARKENKIVMINSQGETLFEIHSFSDEDYYLIAAKFITYVAKENVFGIDKFTTSSMLDSSNKILDSERDTTNVLQKYAEKDNSFEVDNEDYKYMYFKNKDISDKILQVVIKNNKKEEDKRLLNAYLLSEFNDYLDRDIEKIEEFYEMEKDYYLIDKIDNSKIKLECNNIIYEAFYDENDKLCENILLYSNGNIPFCDKEISGYFDINGNKIIANNNYLIVDVNNKYEVIFEGDTGEYYFRNLKNGRIIDRFEHTLTVHDAFLIEYVNYDQVNLYDKNLKLIETFEYEPDFYGSNKIVGYNGEEFLLYNYDKEKIELIASSRSVFYPKNFERNVNIFKTGTTVYPRVGVLIYE